MVDVTRDGRFYIKTWNSVLVPHDGDPYTIFAKIIPPYVSVERAWVHLYYTSAATADLWDRQEILTTMGMTNLMDDGSETTIGTTDGVGTDHSDDDQDHLNGWIGGRLPLAEGMYSGTRQDTALDKHGVGISGGRPLSQWYKDRMIFERSHTLGLGRNALMTGAGAVTYMVDDYVNNGPINVSGHTCNITEPRLIVMQTVTDTPGAETSTGYPNYLLSGDSDLKVDELTSDAWFLFGDQGVTAMENSSDVEETVSSIQAGIPQHDASSYTNVATGGASAQFERWATQGWLPNDQDNQAGILAGDGEDIVVQAKVSLECRTLKPAQRKIWTSS